MPVLTKNFIARVGTRKIGKLVVLLFIGLMVLSGCSSNKDFGNIPRWIDSLYDGKYDEKTYLCSVGSGVTRESAIDAALASLSQVFNSQVKSITSYASVSTALDDGQGTVRFSESSSMIDQGSVTSNTDRIIGAQVVNMWVDGHARVYVRVAVDRKRTTELYQKDIQELGNSITRLKVSAEMTNDPLTQYFILREAMLLARQQQGFIDQVQVLTGQKIPSQYIQLQTQLTQTAARIRISIHTKVVSNEAALSVMEIESTRERLASAFNNLLNELGFTVLSSDEVAPVILEILYGITPIEQPGSPYQYARYELTAQLKSGGKVLVSFQKAEREAALSIRDAIQRALRQALSTGVKDFSILMQKELAGK